MKHLRHGNFAVTTGKSSAESVFLYHERQSEHHRYDQRVPPPVFVESFPRNQASKISSKPNDPPGKPVGFSNGGEYRHPGSAR